MLTALLNLNLSPFNGVCNPSIEGNALLSSAYAASIRRQLSHFPHLVPHCSLIRSALALWTVPLSDNLAC